MKYTQVSATAFQHLQLNAGIIVDEFTTATGTIGNILGATSGGVTFNATPNYVDFGEDIDNCPANTKQLKVVTSYDATLSGSFKSVDSELAAKLAGNATTKTESKVTKITPKDGFVTAGWYDELWWVGDYSDHNVDSTSGTTVYAGYIAIKLTNALNTTGFQIKSTDEEKGEFAFEYHAHYDINDTDTVPFEIYVSDPNAT